MSSHGDILERSEPMSVPFCTSLVMHLALVGALAGAAIWEHRFRINIGSPTGGGIGVMVTPVSTIPIPSRGGPENLVANDTESQVPTPPTPKEKAKPTPQVKAPVPAAISLKTDKVPKRPQEAAAQPNKYRDQQKYSDSQIYSNVGQRANNQSYAVQGGGGVRLGDSSMFGEQFGAYATTVRDAIGRNWKTTELGLRMTTAPPVLVTFTLRRDGSVVNVRIGQTSGNTTLDNSALRAVMDAQLPSMPPQFPGNQTDVSLRFELGNR